jgi:hypothetical protein
LADFLHGPSTGKVWRTYAGIQKKKVDGVHRRSLVDEEEVGNLGQSQLVSR